MSEGAAGNQDPNAQGAQGGQQGAQGAQGNPDPQDWRSGLDPSIKDHPSLANFKEMKDVVKSYVSVQPLIGKEKIPVPPKDAKKEDWDQVFTRLGRPEKADGYSLPDVKLPEGFPNLQTEKLSAFRQKALELNLLPHQASGLFEWYMNDLGTDYKCYLTTRDKSRSDSEAALRKEWGKGFDAKLAVAKNVLAKFGDEALAGLIDEDLGNNPTFIRFLANIGSKMTEDGITFGKSEVTMTPEEATAEIKKIQGDPKHPYFNKVHPEHELAVKRMEDLFASAYPEKS